MTQSESHAGPLAVIGAGPGGYAAAFAAADRGIDVTLIDLGKAPGGVCLHRGCIPSKTLLHAGKLIQEAAEASYWGLEFGAPRIDLPRLREFKSGVIDKLAGGVMELCRRRGVRLIRARARFDDSQTLKLDGAADGEPIDSDTLRVQNTILATGSSPAIPAAFQVNDPRVMDSTQALEMVDVPKSLLVIGGGYIGLELGSVYAALGSKVTVVELTPGLLPGADRDLVRPLQKRLEGLLAKIHLSTKVTAIEPLPEGICVGLQGEEAPHSAVFDRVLVAVGRRPNSHGLGLERTKVTVNEKGFVVVDKSQRTTDPNIFAIGDVAGEPMLAHKASREAKIAVEVLAGEPAAFDNVAIPAVVFTDPELAWCGVTETQAKARNMDVEIQRYPWGASSRANTLARTEGLTKLIVEKTTQRVLGMGVVGVGAGELIAEGVLAVETAATVRDIGDSIHPHPTLSETVMETAEIFLGGATHLYRPKR